MGAILCDRHVHQERPPSPVPTCVSMKSDQSHERRINFQNEDGTNASRQVRKTDTCKGYARKSTDSECRVSQPDIWSRNKQPFYKYFVIFYLYLNTIIPLPASPC